MALLPFRSPLIADIGISFGDEGKGRLISEVIRELQTSTGLNDPVRVVLKVNGGANSGHTAGGLKLNLLPGGVIESSVSILGLGSGVVADPRKLLWECRTTESRGFEVFSRLKIDERTMVSDLGHRLLDLAWESYRENQLKLPARGSTGRGITPAYLDEVGQWQVYYADFLGNPDRLRKRFASRLERAIDTIKNVCKVTEDEWFEFFSKLTNAEKRANSAGIAEGILSEEEVDFNEFCGSEPFTLNKSLFDTYWATGIQFRDAICDIREVVLSAVNDGRSVIGEFGQAYWLDKRHGFTPNVTASHTTTPEFFQSAGVPVQPLHTFGVCKAYDTKVGTHDFLTRIPADHSLSEKLCKIEFGTSTGRQRMVGWFDAVEKGTTLRYNGFDDLVINKLDALTCDGSWEGSLRICTSYKRPDGEIVGRVPRDEVVRRESTPVFEDMEPWDEDIRSVRTFQDLPVNAQIYVAAMVYYTLSCAYGDEEWPKDLPNLRYIGVGPNPDEIIKEIPETTEVIKMLPEKNAVSIQQ
ncbi:MAG: adenylosuccinate synthetase [Verrucomicrobiota bacterium]